MAKFFSLIGCFLFVFFSGQNFIENPKEYFYSRKNKSCDILFEFNYVRDTIVENKVLHKISFLSTKPQGELQFLYFHLQDSTLYTSKVAENKIKLKKWLSYKKNDHKRILKRTHIYLNNKPTRLLFKADTNYKNDYLDFFNFIFKKNKYTVKNQLYDKTISFDIITGFQMSLIDCWDEAFYPD